MLAGSRQASPRLTYIRPFDPWRATSLCTCPFKYTVNPYTGCGHGCLYCYASSYIRDFFNPRPKRDFLYAAARDLSRIPAGAIINISSSSDPYQPLEERYQLTRRLLEIIPEHHAVEIVTKSDLVVRDLDLLSRRRSVVSFTITTLDEYEASRLEPRAPSPSRRLRAMEKVASAGVPVVLRLDPIIPGINDEDGVIEEVIAAAAEAGARHVVTSTYKVRPDNLRRLLGVFPELTPRIRELYIERGERVHGYLYAPRSYREAALAKVKRAAEKHGLSFATCREGLLLSGPGISCDGTHLLPARTASGSASPEAR